MKDFNVKITVRNARLLNAIMANYDSVAHFSREIGVTYSLVQGLVVMRDKPISTLAFGEWRKAAVDIATALHMEMGDLWPDHLKHLRARRASVELEMDAAEVKALAVPTPSLDAAKLLSKWSDGLTPRFSKVVAMWADNATLEEMGCEIGVSRQHARQILLSAQRRMRVLALRDGVRCIRDVDGF